MYLYGVCVPKFCYLSLMSLLELCCLRSFIFEVSCHIWQSKIVAVILLREIESHFTSLKSCSRTFIVINMLIIKGTQHFFTTAFRKAACHSVYFNHLDVTRQTA